MAGAQPLTPDDLRAWQARMGYTADQAAAALDVGRSTWFDWLSGQSPIRGHIAIACAALEAGLAPVGQQSSTSG